MSKSLQVGYHYRGPDELHKLGERIRDKAIDVGVRQEIAYADAQMQAPNGPPGRHAPVDKAKLHAQLADAYQGIPAMFTQFAGPDPKSAQPALDALYQVSATLEPSLRISVNGKEVGAPLQAGGVDAAVPVGPMKDAIVTHMKSWHGDAASNFEDYVKQIGSAAANQRQIALSLADSLAAMIEIRKAVNTDIWEIGEETLKALDQLTSFCDDSAQTQAALTIAGALAAVAFVASEGATVEIGVEGLQAAPAIMGAAPALQGNASIGGATVPAVLTSMTTAMKNLLVSVDYQEEAVQRALDKVHAAANRRMNIIMPPAPELLYAAGGKGRNGLEQPGGFYAG